MRRSLLRIYFAICLRLAIPMANWLDSMRPKHRKGNSQAALLAELVKARLALLLFEKGYRKIAIFGAGKHTIWIEDLLDNPAKAPKVVAVLDDAPDANCKILGLNPVLASSFNPELADAIILSSDTFQEQMRKRCRELYGEKIVLVDLYEGLPPGPYCKY